MRPFSCLRTAHSIFSNFLSHLLWLTYPSPSVAARQSRGLRGDAVGPRY
uniref:Uncharacterized protein n=1 Tax=Strigamia maritima TaxID=126957 RepID=T1JGB0_STRMM